MSWSWTLYRYLGTQFLIGVGTVYSAFVILAFSIAIVVGMAILQFPDLGQKLLPFAILLGGVFAFVRLSRNQELVATRAAGVSAWDFLAPPLVVAISIGIVVVLAITP